MIGEKKIETARSEILETKPNYQAPDVYNVYNLCNNIVSPKDETVELSNITDEVLAMALNNQTVGEYFRVEGHSAGSLPDGRFFNEKLPVESKRRVPLRKENLKVPAHAGECGGV